MTFDDFLYSIRCTKGRGGGESSRAMDFCLSEPCMNPGGAPGWNLGFFLFQMSSIYSRWVLGIFLINKVSFYQSR